MVSWLWSAFFDGACILYLVFVVVVGWDGVGAKQLGIAYVGCLFVAWLIRGRWWWILSLEILLLVVTLFSCVVAWGMMKTYLEHATHQYGDKVKRHRLGLRKARQALLDEQARLRRQL